MTEIGLISCVKTKRDEIAAPRYLYISPYFEKMLPNQMVEYIPQLTDILEVVPRDPVD